MHDIEKLNKLKVSAEAMQYLKKHNANIKKVYSDVNFVGMIQRINQELEYQNSAFKELNDVEYQQVLNIFS